MLVAAPETWPYHVHLNPPVLSFYKDLMSCPGSSGGKESALNAGHLGLIPGPGRSPGKGMATHSSSLPWRIPWTEEADGLLSMGLQRVGHD